MARRTIFLLLTMLLAFMAASTAGAENAKSTACLGKPYSYAGLQSQTTAHGVAATLAPVNAPDVTDGHVGGWIGVGGTNSGPGGVAEWLQVGLSAFGPSRTTRMYYEVTTAGADPKYVELAANVA